jgi:hypothetical protein
MINKCQSFAGSEKNKGIFMIDYPFDSIVFINKHHTIQQSKEQNKQKNNKQRIVDYLNTCSRKNSIVEIITAQAGETFNRRGTRPRKKNKKL